MKIGIVQIFDGTPGRGFEHIIDFARTVEELGFSSLWVPDHVVFFDRYDSPYPHTDSGSIDFKVDQGILEPLMALQAAASATEHIRLGTSVEIITERHPVVRAKELTTLDVFSGGRVEYGVGIGWSTEEYAALGVSFARRGVRCDEYIRAMRALWTEHRPSFSGDFVDFTNVVFEPKPIQRSGIPIVIGGNSDAALRRVARLGDGWHGWKMDAPVVAQRLEFLEAELAARGRSREDIKINVGVPFRGDPSDLAAYAAAVEGLGVNELIIALGISRHTYRGQLAEYRRAFGSLLGQTA